MLLRCPDECRVRQCLTGLFDGVGRSLDVVASCFASPYSSSHERYWWVACMPWKQVSGVQQSPAFAIARVLANVCMWARPPEHRPADGYRATVHDIILWSSSHWTLRCSGHILRMPENKVVRRPLVHYWKDATASSWSVGHSIAWRRSRSCARTWNSL